MILDRGRVVGEFQKAEVTLEELVDKLYLVAQTGSLNNQGEGLHLQLQKETMI